jgi:hypothetical protein
MCLLKIFSDTASFKAYAEKARLPVYSVHDAGDIRRHRTGEAYGVYRISFDVSDREWDDVQGQVQDAIRFLRAHAPVVRQLIDSHPVSDAYLDFPIWSRLDANIVNQNDHLPRELIRLCAEAGIGIEIALYARDAFRDYRHELTRGSDA